MTPFGGHDPHEEGATALGRLARLTDEPIDEQRHAAGRERLLLALGPRSKPRAARGLLLLAAALATVLALAALVGAVLVR